jgi:NitT/TauT family transport system ATP-binding protein
MTAMSGTDFIQFRALTKEFQAPDGSAIRVVDPIGLTIREGEFVVFVGPSGCGKTTVMRMVGGLEAPSSGEIYLAGKRVTGPSRDKGMVFQSYSSFPWLTVLGNIRFGMKYRRDITRAEKDRIARRYLDLVGLGALDALSRERLQIQLMDLRRAERKTVIFVTHDVDEAVLLADRIIVFSARPAQVIEDIPVSTMLPEKRSIDIVDSPEFRRIRRDVLSRIRNEEIEVGDGGSPP